MLSSASYRSSDYINDLTQILSEPISTSNIDNSPVSELEREIIMKCLAFDVSSVIQLFEKTVHTR